MAATASHMQMSLKGPFDPVWSASRQLREGHSSPARGSQPQVSRFSKFVLPSTNIDPGGDMLRSVLKRVHATLFRTKAGQFYEKAAEKVHQEQNPPVESTPGDWFPDVEQAYACKRSAINTHIVEHYFDIVEYMPFLFKALDKIKICWLRNNYPLPARIVRALYRDNFDLISANFGAPLSDVNRYPGNMWLLNSGDLELDKKRQAALARGRGRDRMVSDRCQSRAGSAPVFGIHMHEPNALPKNVIPHRREWNQLLRRHFDDSSGGKTCPHRSADVSGSRTLPHHFGDGVVRGGGSDRSHMGLQNVYLSSHVVGAGAGAAGQLAQQTVQPVAWLVETLFPPWQMVAELERADRRISDVSSISAADAKLVLKRCREHKKNVLTKMDEQYNAKIYKLEDNTQKRYRRKVSYLVPPYRTAGADMPAIRRRVHQRARQEDVVVRHAGWYTRLTGLATTIGAVEYSRCTELLERLQPFCRLEGSQMEHGKEKLCLLLMSLPGYEALQAHVQMAVFFMHVHVFGGSENVFRRWLNARGLVDATATSSLINKFRSAESSALQAEMSD